MRRVPAPAAPLVHVEVAAALVVAAVEVVGLRDARLRRRLAEGVEDVPAQTLVLHAPLPALAVHLVGGDCGLILRLLEIGQHVVPAPARIAELAPVVVVARLAAHVDHAVDRGAAAEHAAPGIADGAAI